MHILRPFWLEFFVTLWGPGLSVSHSYGCVTLHAVGPVIGLHHNASCTRRNPGET